VNEFFSYRRNQMKAVMLCWFRKNSILPGYKIATGKPSGPGKVPMKTSPPGKTGPEYLASERYVSTSAI